MDNTQNTDKNKPSNELTPTIWQRVKTDPVIRARVIMGLCVLYVISPIDIIPDVPALGWIDDSLILSSGAMNLLQAEYSESKNMLYHIARILKWILVGVLVIAVLLFLLFMNSIISYFVQ